MTTIADNPSVNAGSSFESQPSSGESERALDRKARREALRTTKFDYVSSMLLALLLLIAAGVFMLFIVWWDSRVAAPVKALEMLVENAAGRGENAEGTERDFEPPGADEVEALTEPTIQDTITAVTDAVTSVAASLDSVTSNMNTTNIGDGKGDSRPAGPMGEGDDIVPRSERWQLNFAAKNLAGYATQLDFYKIELGALGGEQIQGVDYASGLSGTPKIRRGKSADEKRLYFMWTTESPLKKFDSQLLQKAGIPVPGRQMVKFVEKDLENVIANVELDYAKSKGHQSVKEIAKTVFDSQPKDNGFVFVVVDQRYRKPKK